MTMTWVFGTYTVAPGEDGLSGTDGCAEFRTRLGDNAEEEHTLTTANMLRIQVRAYMLAIDARLEDENFEEVEKDGFVAVLGKGNDIK